MSEQRISDSVADQVRRTLDDAHATLCDDYRERPTVEAVIHAFHQAGLLTAEQARLRSLALNGCPGHSGGGRVWCAYCGNLQEDGHG